MQKSMKIFIWPLIVVLWVLGAVIAPGCGMGPGSQPVTYYTLDYAPPVEPTADYLGTALKVARFSSANGLDALDMLYGPSPLEFSVYNYHRWRVSPGEMVGDFLLRDLRDSRRFKAVFSYRNREKARFNLEGSVEAFREQDQEGGSRAKLTLNLTLLDQARASVADRVVFQRWYRATEPMAQASARELAKAMSKAMQKVSREITGDLHQAVEQRLGQP